MKFNPKKKTSNIILLVAAFVIVSLILWNTNSFFQKFKEEERYKMEIWATAQSEFQSLPADADPGNLHLLVFQKNTSTPMILLSKDGTIKTNNIDPELAKDSLYLVRKMSQFENENTPLVMEYKGEQ